MPLEWGIKTICSLLIAAGLLYAGLSSTNSWTWLTGIWPALFSARSLSHFAKNLGSLAELFTIGAAGLWFIKTLSIQLKKRNISFWKVLKQPLVLLRKHHVLLGWTVLFTVAGHGAYFLFLAHKAPVTVYTGLAAFIVLIFLASAGVWLQFFAPKRKTVGLSKKIHAVLALLFGIAVLLHLSL